MDLLGHNSSMVLSWSLGFVVFRCCAYMPWPSLAMVAIADCSCLLQKRLSRWHVWRCGLGRGHGWAPLPASAWPWLPVGIPTLLLPHVWSAGASMWLVVTSLGVFGSLSR
jgi:hypothetical protein